MTHHLNLDTLLTMTSKFNIKQEYNNYHVFKNCVCLHIKTVQQWFRKNPEHERATHKYTFDV